MWLVLYCQLFCVVRSGFITTHNGPHTTNLLIRNYFLTAGTLHTILNQIFT